MNAIYLPEAVYERLPLIYLVLAALLAVLPLGAHKWALIAALVLAMVVIRRRRRKYREAERVRTSLSLMEKHAVKKRL